MLRFISTCLLLLLRIKVRELNFWLNVIFLGNAKSGTEISPLSDHMENVFSRHLFDSKQYYQLL